MSLLECKCGRIGATKETISRSTAYPPKRLRRMGSNYNRGSWTLLHPFLHLKARLQGGRLRPHTHLPAVDLLPLVAGGDGPGRSIERPNQLVSPTYMPHLFSSHSLIPYAFPFTYTPPRTAFLDYTSDRLSASVKERASVPINQAFVACISVMPRPVETVASTAVLTVEDAGQGAKFARSKALIVGAETTQSHLPICGPYAHLTFETSAQLNSEGVSQMTSFLLLAFNLLSRQGGTGGTASLRRFADPDHKARGI